MIWDFSLGAGINNIICESSTVPHFYRPFFLNNFKNYYLPGIEVKLSLLQNAGQR